MQLTINQKKCIVLVVFIALLLAGFYYAYVPVSIMFQGIGGFTVGRWISDQIDKILKKE